jgi:ATP-dependent Clp protease protease subunit
MPGPNIRFVNKGNKRGEIWLYDVVGEGLFGGMSAKMFIAEVQKLGQVDVINLHINSPGGQVFDGVAIYNSLKNHPARIEVDIDSVAASIASVIAMAGDEIRIAANGMMMIHDPMGRVAGNSADMRKAADLLDQVQQVIASTYAKRTGKKDAQIKDMMSAETWMTAAEALEMGFADLVTDEQRIAACSGFDFSAEFRRAPAHLTGASGARTAGHSMAQVKLVAMDTRSRVKSR